MPKMKADSTFNASDLRLIGERAWNSGEFHTGVARTAKQTMQFVVLHSQKAPVGWIIGR